MGSSCFKEPLPKNLKKPEYSAKGKCINHTWDSKKYLLSEDRTLTTCSYQPNHIDMEHISRVNDFYASLKSGRNSVTLENTEICLRNLNKCKENVRHYNYCSKDNDIGKMEQISRNEELIDLYLIILYFNHLAIKNYGPSENFLKSEKIKKNNSHVNKDDRDVHEVVRLEEEEELGENLSKFGSEYELEEQRKRFVSDSNFIGKMSSNHGDMVMSVGKKEKARVNGGNVHGHNRNHSTINNDIINNTEKLALLYTAQPPPVYDPNNVFQGTNGSGNNDNNNNNNNNGATPQLI